MVLNPGSGSSEGGLASSIVNSCDVVAVWPHWSVPVHDRTTVYTLLLHWLLVTESEETRLLKLVPSQASL